MELEVDEEAIDGAIWKWKWWSCFCGLGFSCIGNRTSFYPTSLRLCMSDGGILKTSLQRLPCLLRGLSLMLAVEKFTWK
jgi:hypothetical protein